MAKTIRATPWEKGSVKTSPGYFGITLESGVQAEMTVTNHTALYRFTFPDKPQAENATLKPVIVQDVTDLNNPGGWNAKLDINATTGRIRSSARFNPSFGLRNYHLKICTDFMGAKILQTDEIMMNDKEKGGAWVQFDKPEADNQIYVRVGLSFISREQACQNAEKELPDWDFEAAQHAAVEAWAEKLSPVSIKAGDVSEEHQTVFWSGIYRSMISPQDYTNENPLWKSKEPYFDSFYCIWDSYRTVHPLLTMIDPDAQTAMIRGLIDIYKHEGYLPDCRMSLCPGYTQGGSDADNLIVDSWLKGISHPKLNWTTGFQAIVKDAEKPTKDWDTVGRGGLPEWKKLGYIPLDEEPFGRGLKTRSISRTMEYAYNDFCIARMAQDFGTKAQVKKYEERASNWENLFNEEEESHGYKGFVQPKYANGEWGYQDPTLCSPLNSPDSCYLNPTGHETYEGSCWLYTFSVPQDHAKIVEKLGGPEKFTERADYFHDSGLLYVGDEQSFLNIYLYHYSERPAKSAERIHEYIPSLWNTSVNGIPGNDDTGAMGSAATFMMMGLFPNAGQDVYLITPPFFPEVSIRHPWTGNVATIRNKNFDADYKNIYIQKATYNGKDFPWSWITHNFFLEGGVLELTLGPKESKWGTKPKHLPPSLSVKRTAPGPAELISSTGSSSSSSPSSSFSFTNLIFLAAIILAIALIGSFFYKRYLIRKKYETVPAGDEAGMDVELDNEPLMRNTFAEDDDLDEDPRSRSFSRSPLNRDSMSEKDD
jgi:predicted alpha-1,2-mannosidase